MPSKSLSYQDTLIGADNPKRPKQTILGDFLNGANYFGALWDLEGNEAKMEDILVL